MDTTRRPHSDSTRQRAWAGAPASPGARRHRQAWPLTCCLLWVLALLLSSCSEDRRFAFGGIEGRVVFMGPVANAPVTLIRLEDGRGVQTMATGVTDSDGRFVFRPLIADVGRYRVVAELAGLPWTYRDRSGVHPEGTLLSATLTDYGRYAERTLWISPYTTLADAIGDTLRRVDATTDGEERARAGFVAHLDLDPAQAEIGEPLGDVAREATRHRLLIDAFDVLCDQLGEAAGRPDGAFHPGQVLAALLADARGTEPAGRFDGLGPAGAVFLETNTTPLDAETLRSHLAASVLGLVETDPRWSAVSPAAVAPIMRHLTCSPSSLFAECDPSAAGDPTPPIIDAIDPAPGTPLVGVVDIRVRAHEPDGTLARVELTLVNGDRRTPIPAQAGPGYLFRVDTEALQGVARLDAEVRAVNGAGLDTRRNVSWPLPDREIGTLHGFVYKGRARRARVEAFDLTDPPLQLAATTTDETGAFALDIVAYAGPVRLVVSDDVAATGGPSVYDDEARGERRWRSGRTLRALVPEFRSTAPEQRAIIVTPFSDMALAYAHRIHADGGLLVSAYEEALAALSAQLGLEASAQSLLFTHPAPVDTPVIDFQGAERLGFALGCFSTQAQRLGEQQLGDAPDAFDPLDLVALYRLDLEADGLLDGRTGNVAAVLPLSEGEVRLPPDPLRTDFVAACGRWQAHPANGMQVDPAEAIRHYQRLTRFAEAPLYDGSAPPPPFDESPPSLTLSAAVTVIEGAPEGAVHLADFPTPEETDAPDFDPSKITTVRGAVTITLDLEDPSGIGEASARLTGLVGRPENGTFTRTDLGPTAARLTLTVDTTLLEDRRHQIDVRFADFAGNSHREQRRFAVDNTPPEVELNLPADTFHPVGERIYTNHRADTTLSVSWNDLSVVHVEGTFGGDEILSLSRQRGDAEASAALDFALVDEGERTLALVVTDLTGLRTVVERPVLIDRRPPTVTERFLSWYDEVDLPLGREPTPDTPVILSSDPNAPLVRRWQNAWGPDASHPAGLLFDLADAEGPALSPAEGVQLSLSVCLSDGVGTCRAEPPPLDLTLTGADPVLPFTAGPAGPDEARPRTLPFDPLADPPAPGYFTVRLHEVTDLAGNRRAINATRVFRHHVVAPPLEVTIRSQAPFTFMPANFRRMENLSIVDGDLAELLTGQAQLHLHEVEAHNPHDFPVPLRITLSGSYRLTSQINERVVGSRVDPNTSFLRLTSCDTPPGAPVGTLPRRPLPRNDCTPINIGGIPYLSCSTCMPAPTAAVMRPMNLELTATGRGTVVPEAGQIAPVNGPGARHWDTFLEAGERRRFAVGVQSDSRNEAPVHESSIDVPELPDGLRTDHAVVERAPLAYYYSPTPNPISPDWLSGQVRIEVSQLTMSQAAAVQLQAGARLNDASTQPVTAGGLSAITRVR